jgi:putative ABC transport system substrate-binding protein
LNAILKISNPGGNVTGLSMQATELVSKRCELLHEILPDLRRMTVMGNVGYSAVSLEMREVEAAARTLGLEIDIAELRRAADISPAFDTFKSRVQALYVCADALVNANSVRINTLALGAHLPTMYPTRSPFIDGGGLMAYGPNNVDLFRRAGDYVDKILRGTKPGDILVE